MLGVEQYDIDTPRSEAGRGEMDHVLGINRWNREKGGAVTHWATQDTAPTMHDCPLPTEAMPVAGWKDGRVVV